MTTTVNQNYDDSASDYSEHSETPSPPVPRSPRSFLPTHGDPNAGINDVPDSIDHGPAAIEMQKLNAPTNANPDASSANSNGQANAPAPANAPQVPTGQSVNPVCPTPKNRQRHPWSCTLPGTRGKRSAYVIGILVVLASITYMIAHITRKPKTETEAPLSFRRSNIFAAAETIQQDVPSSAEDLIYDGDGMCRFRCACVDGWRVEYSPLSDRSSVYNYHDETEHSDKEPLEVINDGDGMCRVQCSDLDGWRVDYSPLRETTSTYRHSELIEHSDDDFLEDIEDWIDDADRGYFDNGRGYKGDDDTGDLAGALLDKHGDWGDDVKVTASTHIRVITLLDVNVITLSNVYTIPVSGKRNVTEPVTNAEPKTTSGGFMKYWGANASPLLPNRTPVVIDDIDEEVVNRVSRMVRWVNNLTDPEDLQTPRPRDDLLGLDDDDTENPAGPILDEHEQRDDGAAVGSPMEDADDRASAVPDGQGGGNDSASWPRGCCEGVVATLVLMLTLLCFWVLQ
ncbi:hypothetical protein BCR34DRAFT_559251 [Clohesyomyces aquaticus]|uniref:Uncharacterized protein n=1 Tax=Clohesyomyces aquaticus TaxID=1231657 RepID=A0A1Y1ZYQ3_9PLEO|nr:hypothetical protein BCR34DRAFT_559251 [Clohesyomyces aquaticus]